MPKRVRNIFVYDARKGYEVGARLEIETTEFLLDALEEKALTDQILAQEAYDSVSGEITITARIRVFDRNGKLIRRKR